MNNSLIPNTKKAPTKNVISYHLQDSLKKIKKHWQLYLVFLIPLAYIIIFHYVPMYGVTLAFKDFSPKKGILGSNWVGMSHFNTFFRSPSFWKLIVNTLSISTYSLIAGFPVPILLALMLNEVKNKFFKKSVQMITYAPFFISTIVMVALLMQWMDPRFGLFNMIIKLFGGESINFMGIPEYFRSIYVWSGVWQFTGFNSIIYLAALSGISQELYEAAKIDGASRLQKIIHIDIPGILPTVVILLILNAGQIMNIGFEKIYAMQNSLNSVVSEVIPTYVYKVGLLSMNYSFSTAVGLFNSVINLILILSVNTISKRMNQSSLF